MDLCCKSCLWYKHERLFIHYNILRGFEWATCSTHHTQHWRLRFQLHIIQWFALLNERKKHNTSIWLKLFRFCPFIRTFVMRMAYLWKKISLFTEYLHSVYVYIHTYMLACILLRGSYFKFYLHQYPNSHYTSYTVNNNIYEKLWITSSICRCRYFGVMHNILRHLAFIHRTHILLGC